MNPDVHLAGSYVAFWEKAHGGSRSLGLKVKAILNFFQYSLQTFRILCSYVHALF